jgi:hypothetical protein
MPSLPMHPMRPGKRSRPGATALPLPPCMDSPGKEPCPTSRGLGVNLDLVVEGRSADREREAGVRGVPGLFANSNRAPLRTRGAVRPGVPVRARVPVRPRVPVRARGLRGLSGGMRREVRLQVRERVGEARVVWLDLQQRLVTADRVVEPGPAIASGEVRSLLPRWPRSRWAPASLRQPPRGLTWACRGRRRWRRWRLCPR